jgi:hypothetical protein
MTIEDNDCSFGQVVFINDVNCNHFNFEKWNTPKRLLMQLIDHENPLVWWAQYVV